MRPIRTILHPTDFSPGAQEALELACSLAREHGACLVLLHVVPSAEAIPPSESSADKYRNDLKYYREEMQGKLRQLPLPGVGFLVERMLKEGEVAKAILQAAEQTSCELIVMGTHGRTGEAKVLMGSVAEEITRRAPCSVVTVKRSARNAPSAR